MTEKPGQSQGDRIRNHFLEHVYYRVCSCVHATFCETYTKLLISPVELFRDASFVLDNILETGDEDYCRGLWREMYTCYRRREGSTNIGEDDTTAEVAMLYYAVMYGLTSTNEFYYKCTLPHILHEKLAAAYGQNNCMDMARTLAGRVGCLSGEMNVWMEGYFTSKQSLTEEIDAVLRPKKQKKSSSEDKAPKPYTLAYNCNDKQQRSKRITYVRRKWEEWGWIESNTDVEDFEAFFKGGPRDCQLKWTGSNAVLTMLVSELLKQGGLFTKQTGCSAKSVVTCQFRKTYDKHPERVDALDRNRIEWSVGLLDYTTPLDLPQLSYHNGDDIRDAALQEVFAGNMSITKDLNKYGY